MKSYQRVLLNFLLIRPWKTGLDAFSEILTKLHASFSIIHNFLYNSYWIMYHVAYIGHSKKFPTQSNYCKEWKQIIIVRIHTSKAEPAWFTYSRVAFKRLQVKRDFFSLYLTNFIVEKGKLLALKTFSGNLQTSLQNIWMA